MPIRVAVVDDHEVVREGLRALFAGTDIEVVAEISSGDQLVGSVSQNRPDVVLLDVRMPDVDGIMALEHLRQKMPDLPVVMLSSYDNPTYVARSAALGAANYVLKGCPRDELIDAVARAARRQPASTDGLMHRVKSAMARRTERSEQDPPLTNRELQVLRHIALGLSNKEIGRSLDISVETVKEHVQNTLRKIGVTDRTQAAVWAVRRGIV